MYSFFQCHIGSVLLIGDSLVRWASGQLTADIRVIWQGKSGAHLDDIFPLLAARQGPDPSVLLIHVGTNDLISMDEFCMRQRILLLLNSCTVRFPDTVLIWSAMLPRVFYFGARSQSSLERKRKALNRWARKQCSKLGAHYLPHPQFVWTETALYRYDGVHLSPRGNAIFRDNLSQGIQSVLGNH